MTTIRPVFKVEDKKIVRYDISFVFYNGYDPADKKRSIMSLHDAFRSSHPGSKVLEVSTKSPAAIGNSLSAFNLKITLKNGRSTSVESAFQSSKVFTGGVQYKELLYAPPIVAKKDGRLRNSGDIIGFSFQNEEFEKDPKTYFYNWIYINALSKRPDLLRELSIYDSFTDIEFNPKRSINSQAESVAIAVMLYKNNMLDSALSDKSTFKSIIGKMCI